MKTETPALTTRLLRVPLLLAPLVLAPLAQAAGTVRVSDPKLPFSVTLPSSWVGVNFKDGLSGVSLASQAKSPAALMRFTFIPKQGRTLNLKSEFMGFEQAVRQGGATLKLVSEKPATYGGVGGLTHMYDLTQKGKTLRMQIWFGNGSKNFYNFQLTDQSSTFAKRQPQFTAALASVKFK